MELLLKIVIYSEADNWWFISQSNLWHYPRSALVPTQTNCVDPAHTALVREYHPGPLHQHCIHRANTYCSISPVAPVVPGAVLILHQLNWCGKWMCSVFHLVVASSYPLAGVMEPLQFSSLLTHLVPFLCIKQGKKCETLWKQICLKGSHGERPRGSGSPLQTPRPNHMKGSNLLIHLTHSSCGPFK